MDGPFAWGLSAGCARGRFQGGDQTNPRPTGTAGAKQGSRFGLDGSKAMRNRVVTPGRQGCTDAEPKPEIAAELAGAARRFWENLSTTAVMMAHARTVRPARTIIARGNPMLRVSGGGGGAGSMGNGGGDSWIQPARVSTRIRVV